MPPVFSRERLSDLLIDPREDLDFEIKNWLDLRNDNDAKAIFAKAALAMAITAAALLRSEWSK
jgi:hypothetical protein